MLEVISYSTFSATILTIILLIYGTVILISDGVNAKKDFRDKEYLKECFKKLVSTFLIFFPMNLLVSILICYIISKFAA